MSSPIDRKSMDIENQKHQVSTDPKDFHPEIEVKESTVDKTSRFMHAFLFAALGAAMIGAAASFVFAPNPVSVLVFAVAGVALTALMLKVTIPELIPLLPEPLRSAAHYLWGSAVELVAVAASALLYPSAAIDLDPKELPPPVNGKQRVTIMVHGFLHNKSGWEYMKHTFKANDMGPVFTVNLGHPLHSIEDFEKVLAKKVDEIKKLAGGAELEIDLVAHSMGSLVSIDYAAKLQENPKKGIRISSITTLGGPIKGTPMAELARFCPCADQMRSRSQFPVDLEERCKKLDKIQFNHFGFGADLIVPASRSHYEGKNHKYAFFPHLGHLSGMYSQEVSDAAIRGIKARRAEEAKEAAKTLGEKAKEGVNAAVEIAGEKLHNVKKGVQRAWNVLQNDGRNGAPFFFPSFLRQS